MLLIDDHTTRDRYLIVPFICPSVGTRHPECPAHPSPRTPKSTQQCALYTTCSWFRIRVQPTPLNYQRTLNLMEGAGHSPLFWHFSRNTITRRQRLFEKSVTWEHLRRCQDKKPTQSLRHPLPTMLKHLDEGNRSRLAPSSV